MARLRSGISTAQYTTPQYGQEDYEAALGRYDAFTGKYGDLVTKGLEQVGTLTDYYKPGGEYGKGLKTQAKETVQAGEARSLGAQVSAGQSSQFAARGVSVLASAELAKLYQNIEDTRNQLLQSAFAPYAQMIQTLGQLASSAPKRSQYVTPGQPSVTGYKFLGKGPFSAGRGSYAT